jgi:hypothetical protein
MESKQSAACKRWQNGHTGKTIYVGSVVDGTDLKRLDVRPREIGTKWDAPQEILISAGLEGEKIVEQ